MITIPQERWAYFAGRVDNETVGPLIEDITKLHDSENAPPICLHVSSGGGDSLVGFSFYEFMASILKPKLETVAVGEVGSIAVLMYMVGDKRYITKNSTVYLHEFAMSFMEKSTWSLTLAKAKLADMTVDQDHYVSIITGRSGGRLSRRKLLTLMRNNATLNAEQAARLGIAHEILE